MFKILKRSPSFPTVWLIGLAVCLAGALLTVSSMEYAPITPVKLLITALCIIGLAVTTRQLSYKRPIVQQPETQYDNAKQQQPDAAA